MAENNKKREWVSDEGGLKGVMWKKEGAAIKAHGSTMLCYCSNRIEYGKNSGSKGVGGWFFLSRIRTLPFAEELKNPQMRVMMFRPTPITATTTT